jgi:hypothetical protein
MLYWCSNCLPLLGRFEALFHAAQVPLKVLPLALSASLLEL